MQEKSSAALVRGLAGAAILVLLLLPAAAYFLIQYAAKTERLAHEARVQALVVSKLISRNPDAWRFAGERITTAIVEVGDPQSQSRVVDAEGRELAVVGAGDGRWRARRQAVFYDFGVEAGTVEVSVSLQQVLGIGAALAGAGACVGLVLLGVLRKRVFRPLDEAEAALRQSSERLRISAIAFQAAEGLLITDARGVILQVNPAFTAATGYTSEEIAGQNLRMLGAGQQDQAFFDRLWRTLAVTGVWEGEILNRRKGGEVYPARVTITAVRREDGVVTHYVKTHVDISASKAAERVREKFTAERESLIEQLTIAKDQAEAANRAKSEFLSSMSHELRTPLNAVLGFSQLLAMDARFDADVKEQVREIERAGEHLLALVNDVIDLARIESGRLEITLKPVPVARVMAESLSMTAGLVRAHGVRLLSPDAAQADGLVVRVDYVRLRQVLINLLSNAIKYNRPQGTVSLQCRLQEGAVRISVADTGPGIPQDKQARLFTAFDRLGAECGNIEGTGIGLVITRRLVQSMGGVIGFESAEGQGSTFWVSFPQVEAAAGA